MAGQTADAVVIGAGPNGLVAANALVDAGWDVVVLEANDEVGGAVRSAEVTAPGFVNDMFSAFYPLAAASPVIRGLDLGAHGLALGAGRERPRARPGRRPGRGPLARRHAYGGERGRVRPRRRRGLAGDVRAVAPDPRPAAGRAVHPVPPDHLDRAAAAPAGHRRHRRPGPAGRDRPCAGSADERFDGAGAALLLEGNAMHSDVPPDAAGSGVFGWLLAMLGQDVGFPVPARRRPAARVVAAAADRRRRRRGPHRRPRDLGRPVRRPRGRRAAAGRYDGHRPQGGPRRRPGARAVRRAGRARPPAGDVRARPGDSSSGTTRRSRSTGRSTGRCPGVPTAPGAPAPSTWARTPTASSTSPPT